MGLRFHLDENVSGAIARGLRERGIDVTTTADVGLLGASDDHQLEFAAAQGRVIVTHDDDFMGLHAGGLAHAGIVDSARPERTVGEIIRAIILISEVLGPDEMRNSVEFI